MALSCVVLWLFFFKQKTAYDMRISDWSSDVCSSDLSKFNLVKPIAAKADLRSPLSWPRHRRNCFHAFHVQPQAAAMIALVRTALARPLTFIVMAILIFGIGILAIARTPVDIFPRIGVPVISVAWSRSEEHTSELQSLMRISYAVFCLKKNNNTKSIT